MFSETLGTTILSPLILYQRAYYVTVAHGQTLFYLFVYHLHTTYVCIVRQIVHTQGCTV